MYSKDKWKVAETGRAIDVAFSVGETRKCASWNVIVHPCEWHYYWICASFTAPVERCEDVFRYRVNCTLSINCIPENCRCCPYTGSAAHSEVWVKGVAHGSLGCWVTTGGVLGVTWKTWKIYLKHVCPFWSLLWPKLTFYIHRRLQHVNKVFT